MNNENWKGFFLLLIPIGCPLSPRYLIACKLSKLFLLKKMDLQNSTWMIILLPMKQTL